MNKEIDLELIIDQFDYTTYSKGGKMPMPRYQIKKAMLEFGRQLLEIASEDAKVNEKSGLRGIWHEVDKQSILDVIKKVKP